MRRRTLLLALAFTTFVAPSLHAAPDASALHPSLRLNQIQVVGTHNSYHLEPFPAVLALAQSEPFRRAFPSALSATTGYSHPSLTDQLTRQNVRQLELDLFPDPLGGHFSEPLGQTLALRRGEKLPTDLHAIAPLTAPGLKILHKPEFDYRTNTPSFVSALRELRAWSQKNPGHIPVLVLIELKTNGPASGVLTAITDPHERTLVAAFPASPAWTDDQLATVEAEILSVFPLEKILTPAEVRGDAPTLRDAILTRGWPELEAVRGRVMFALDNENALRDRYLALPSRRTERLLFVSVPPEHPEAAWMKINNPVRDFTRIQEMVRAGFLVRTRADEELREAKTNDTSRRERAFASGAQFVSTDFPAPDPRYSDYCVTLPGNADAALNPVSAPRQHPLTPPVAP
jgi:hypothetical protein